MAQFSNMIIVNSGLDMIAESQAGGKLIFTKAKLGDGQVGETNIQTLTDIISPKLTVNLSNVTKKEAGHVEVRFTVDNTNLNVGFFAREVGIYAKIGEDGTEKLYGYANAGNYTDYLPDKTTPIDAMTVVIDVVVGNTSEIGFETDKTLVYVTLEDMEDAIAAHNENDDAHADFTGATAEAAGKRGMVPEPQAGDQNKALFGDKSYKSVVRSVNGVAPDENNNIILGKMLKRSESYAYGDIAYSDNLPSWAYLYCVQAGTTAASEPSFTSVNAMGQYITDGSVKWIVDDVRFNIPVGVPFYDTYLHDGCVKLNGATVNRADYIRPAKIATDKNLWTSSPSTEPYKYGNGNGSTTMTLPDYRNRVIQGGDSTAVVSAGLPEIYGAHTWITLGGTGPGALGAFSISQTYETNQNTAARGTATPSYDIKFNASAYNSIYGNSTTVQPPALILIPQIKF